MKPITYKTGTIPVVKLISKDNVCYVGEYIDMRIERDSVPKNKYVYECRHGDDGDWVTPVTIEDHVYVNFAGTFITDKPIVFPNPDDRYIPLRGVIPELTGYY